MPWASLLLVESINSGHWLSGEILVIGWGVVKSNVSHHLVCHYNIIIIKMDTASLFSHHCMSWASLLSVESITINPGHWLSGEIIFIGC